MDALSYGLSGVAVTESAAVCERCQGSVDKLCCSRCQEHGMHVYYCSRACQVQDYRNHKLVCGPLSPSAPDLSTTVAAELPAPLTSFPPDSTLLPALVTQLTFQRTHLEYSYLYQFGASPVSIPLPLTLPPSTVQVYGTILRAAAFGNQLSVELLHTLLLDEVLQAGGTDAGLVAQLSSEFGFDLAARLALDLEPTEFDLTAAVGGEICFPLLLEWQMAEATRSQHLERLAGVDDEEGGADVEMQIQ